MGNGEGVTLSKGFMGIAGALVVTLTAAFLLMGANTKINELSAKVANLEADVEELSNVSRQIDILDARLDDTARQIAELDAIRNDIIRAICEVTEGPQCDDVSG